jgi:tRNA (guanine10-N2)-dimethyltransferase
LLYPKKISKSKLLESSFGGGEGYRSLFVLSGEDLSLPFGELRALVETYSAGEACSLISPRVAVSSLGEESKIQRISERSSYCRFGGSLIASGSSFETLVGKLPEFAFGERSTATFAIRSETLSRERCGDLGALTKARTKLKVSLDRPDLVFQVEKVKGGYFLGLSRTGAKQFSWKERRPRARSFFLPSAIYPKLARALVNMSRVREGERFLDPFCGTGSLLIESCLMGIPSYGFEIKRWVARGASLNMKKYGSAEHGILRCDSTGPLPVSRIDGVATDVPYGRASSTKGKETKSIIREFLQSLADSVPSRKKDGRRKYCVIMYPSMTELVCDPNSFRLEETHYIYVHRNLTRAISVLSMN